MIISCQNKPQITIYVGPSSNESGIVELEIEDGKYQVALEKYKSIYLIDEAYIYNNMASAYSELGQFEEAIDFAIKSYNTLNKIYPVTNDNQKMKEHCKSNLKTYYQNWSSNSSDEMFESWFEDKVTQIN